MLQLQSFDDCKQLSGSVIAMNPSRNGNKGAIYSYNLDSYKGSPDKSGGKFFNSI